MVYPIHRIHGFGCFFSHRQVSTGGNLYKILGEKWLFFTPRIDGDINTLYSSHTTNISRIWKSCSFPPKSPCRLPLTITPLEGRENLRQRLEPTQTEADRIIKQSLLFSVLSSIKHKFNLTRDWHAEGSSHLFHSTP